jgi:hypothetical protein
MINLFKYIRIADYKRYQKRFSEQFVKQSLEKPEYEYLLKHYDKKTWHDAFYCVAIYDVLDNKGFKKLINSIYRLKKQNKEYEVETHYINHRFGKVNYISKNYEGGFISHIADIKLKNHKWLSKIDISFTYCNLSEVVIEYRFCFKKVINSSVLRHRFVVDELPTTTKELYFHSFANRQLISNLNFNQMFECDSVFFLDILQAYICSLFFTNYGKNYQLPAEFCITIRKYNSKTRKRINKLFLHWCYEHKYKTEHLLVDSLSQDRRIFYHYIHGRCLGEPILLRYFKEYSMEMYFQSFYNLEISELDIHMRKYLNSNKKYVSVKDIKWIINKLRYINEQKRKIKLIIENKEVRDVDSLNEWELYLHGKKEDNYYFIMFPEYIEKFEAMYNNNLEYLNSISSTQNDKVIIVITVLTLAATLIGVLASIFVPIIINNLQK